MKKVLVLGAGRVSRPCVDYLGRLEGTVIHVADVSEENLRQTVSGIPGANIHVCDAGSQGGRLIDEIGPDIVINLLPPAFMPPMAKECLKNRIPLVHPAYLDKETKDLSKDIAAAGVTFVTELGLDPGIDHMSAARTIDRIRREGERWSPSVRSAGPSPPLMRIPIPGVTSFPGLPRALSVPARGTHG